MSCLRGFLFFNIAFLFEITFFAGYCSSVVGYEILYYKVMERNDHSHKVVDVKII